MKTKGSRNKKGVSRIKTKAGYIDIFNPEHPLARKNGYVFEHRMMAYDNGLLIDPLHEVHHKNGIKDDNRLDNFEVMTKSKHTSLTWTGRSRSENEPECKFCDTRVRSKHGLCRKHYKLEWQRGNLITLQ